MPDMDATLPAGAMPVVTTGRRTCGTCGHGIYSPDGQCQHCGHEAMQRIQEGMTTTIMCGACSGTSLSCRDCAMRKKRPACIFCNSRRTVCNDCGYTGGHSYIRQWDDCTGCGKLILRRSGSRAVCGACRGDGA